MRWRALTLVPSWAQSAQVPVEPQETLGPNLLGEIALSWHSPRLTLVRRDVVMTHAKQLKVGVDAVTEAKVSLRAQERGVTVSEYVRSLILRDLDGGEAPREPERTDTWAHLALPVLEVALVTGILVRAHLGWNVGEEDAQAISKRAHDRADEQIRVLTGDGSGR